MARDRRVPHSYDEIVRKTVPDPDSSQRPTRRQEQAAYEGFRALDPREEALQARVIAALEDAGYLGIEVDVAHETITLHGHVVEVHEIDDIETIVANIDGVGRVINRLVVRS